MTVVPERTPSLPSGLFHPAVGAWFTETLGRPTSPQVRAWPAIKRREPTLIAAPTGSGKTLAAFLAVIDDLVREGAEEGLPETTLVVYVSPLKALSNDIEKNLEEPLEGIRSRLDEADAASVHIRTAVRTGDTPPKARVAMLRKPPHILVTTPESLYILLTSDGGRRMLEHTRTVIVDEIHAMITDKRGSHLAVTLERLEHLVRHGIPEDDESATGHREGEVPLRIGLSATQKPIDGVADFLFGTGERTIVDLGHRRRMDLAIELPESPLEAVMSNEVWEEVYNRLATLVDEHRTTLIFSNTRRQTERITKHLSDRIGKDAVTAHHGSLSKEHRLDAENRLKKGELRALVATAALELGIDIGSVDLVCQVGCTRTISALLQRVGRSGHRVGAVPKGRLFPLSRDELVEAVAVLDAIDRGELDHLIVPEEPIDILAQQIVAAVACEDWDETELYEMCRKSHPFRDLDRATFDEVVAMLRDGFTTRIGRRGAYVHHDRVGGRLRARRGARLTALTNGGSIPDNADYEVVLEPSDTRVGSVNEDFAIESMPGNIFQLGNASWRILKIESGKLRVEDARGQPPTIPFWFGEAPSRSEELSESVCRLRNEVADRALADREGAITWLGSEHRLRRDAAEQLVDYLSAGLATLGAMPSQTTLVLERFFDEAGGMQLVLHSPFGSRLNRAWGLALRKRFCKKFNFELQAAATEDAIVLSLGTTHSFDIAEVFHYLSPETVRDVLIQAMLDAPLFNVRWRWNAGRALAIQRFRGGRKVPPPLQRMNADDLIAVVFPDQLACFENIQGAREVPEHPLVDQTIRDCLEEAMDIEGLRDLLGKIRRGEVELVARDLTEPSPLAQEILNARPYAFLDDAPLEERRTQAVINRRWLDPETASDLGALDADAIDLVREEAAPDPESADELHDAIVLAGFLTVDEIDSEWKGFVDELIASGRLTRLETDTGLWVAAERLSEMRAVLPGAGEEPTLALPESLDGRSPGDTALVEILRSRLEILGPVTAEDLARPLTCDGETAAVASALAVLQGEGFVLEGRFSPGARTDEWCERRLLARIHRKTLRRLRKEIEPVPAEAFVRFLVAWQHVEPGGHKASQKGLEEVLRQLEGFELPAGAWEEDVLPARVENYDPAWIDALCLAGKAQWLRRSAPARSSASSRPGPVRSTPIALVKRGHRPLWQSLRHLWTAADGDEERELICSPSAARVLEHLQTHGASFFDEISAETRLLGTQLESCLGELTSLGAASSDNFLGLRALLVPTNRRKSPGSRRRTVDYGLEDAGRWSALTRARPTTGTEDVEGSEDREDGAFENRSTHSASVTSGAEPLSTEDLETIAWTLLRRWGVVFRRILDRETGLPAWRDLLRVLRRLEARGEIRGGRFVNRFSGEQFALPEAVPALRKKRRPPEEPGWISLSGADPLNLVGIILPGSRVPALSVNRILLRDGAAVAACHGGKVVCLEELDPADAWDAEKRLLRRLPATAERDSGDPAEDERETA